MYERPVAAVNEHRAAGDHRPRLVDRTPPTVSTGRVVSKLPDDGAGISRIECRRHAGLLPGDEPLMATRLLCLPDPSATSRARGFRSPAFMAPRRRRTMPETRFPVGAGWPPWPASAGRAVAGIRVVSERGSPARRLVGRKGPYRLDRLLARRRWGRHRPWEDGNAWTGHSRQVTVRLRPVKTISGGTSHGEEAESARCPN